MRLGRFLSPKLKFCREAGRREVNITLEPLARAVSERCAAYPQKGTTKERCWDLFLDAGVLREHVGGPLSAGSESLLPKANELLQTLNQQGRSPKCLRCPGSPSPFRDNGKQTVCFLLYFKSSAYIYCCGEDK